MDLADGTWHHIAVTKDSNGRKLWHNGSLVASDTETGLFNASTCVIGNMPWASRLYKGFMRDFRISDNIRYSGTFTPPEEPLVSDSNTKILTCHLPYLVDSSTNAHTITRYGDPALEPASPYDTQEYAVGDHGGSVYLDGTGDRLTVGSTTDLGFGTGDFTIEYWIKHEGKLSGSNYPYGFDMRSQDNEAKLALYHRTNASNVVGIYVSQNTIVSGTNQMYDGMDWAHYAICKTGGNLKGYFNGKQDFSVADTTDYGSSGQISIGSTYSNLFHMQGHIADFRVVKGTAVYTGEFTPPTEPLTAITNTSLLLRMQGAKIFDKAQSVDRVTLQNSATASTTQYKYLPTSIDFTSSLAYVQGLGLTNTFAGDYTVEAWIWSSAINNDGTNNMAIIDYRPSNTNGQYFSLWAKADYKLGLYINSAYRIESNTLLTNSTWHHIAISRQSGATRMFIDGTLQTQNWTDSTNYTIPSGRPLIANSGYHVSDGRFDFNGYMSDVRFTAGLARYTANFTPPSAALQG